MSSAAFVDRVLRNLPRWGSGFAFASWKQAGKVTKEGVGILATSVDVDRVVARVMDVDHYVGNVDYVETCRSISDPGHEPPKSARFYQKIKLPVIGALHHELVLEDLGERDGWRVLGWYLHRDAAKLSARDGARAAYNDGAWLIRPEAVGYALSSAPLKDDVGRLKFAALTKGADAGASKAIQANIEGMLAWSRRA